jgi:dihydrofolate synthase/folylpolyglutamate synthase
MMSYTEALELLERRLPMFSAEGKTALRPGLENISRLCAALGDPQRKFPSVHIAGTNGKGSTSHMLAAAFQTAGYKTGLYTSPHLVDLRERVRIDGQPISESFVADFVERCVPLIDEIKPSYFELNVAMAFAAFADAGVGIAVIETGLGGRLDSTNIIDPVLSVITNIALDHTQILGNSLEAIAKEKAGIIKPNIPVVIGETQEETEQVFFLEAYNKQSTIVYADSIWDMVRTGQDSRHQHFKAIHRGEHQMYDLTTDLLGNYQLPNIKTVLAACELLRQMGWNLDRNVVLSSLSRVKPATGLRGRWDWLRQRPNIILDVAHNPAGMSYAMENLKALLGNESVSKVRILCGFVSDKDISTSLALMPRDATYYFTQAAIPRALPSGDLLQIAQSMGLSGSDCGGVDSAMKKVLEDLAENETLLITGSFFVVGEALKSISKGDLLHTNSISLS